MHRGNEKHWGCGVCLGASLGCGDVVWSLLRRPGGVPPKKTMVSLERWISGSWAPPKRLVIRGLGRLVNKESTFEFSSAYFVQRIFASILKPPGIEVDT